MNNSKNIFDKLKNDKTDTILVVIEVPNGSDIKYEVDHNSGLLFVDRKLFTSMRYPCNYGFIPNTLEGDGDPVDVLVLGDFTLTPFSILKAKPIGVLLTQDEKGKDSKIIAIPDKKIDQSYS
ncbi:MAG: inorganic pyrophosphatase, partial [Nitrososphaeraceae archaeon]|nr:inorganic pyrophosphatase [Nitrososphaeraceae archaeon]